MTVSNSQPNPESPETAALDTPGDSFLSEAFDPLNRGNPLELYERSRELAPVQPTSGHLWFTFNHADAQTLLRSKKVSSNEFLSNNFKELKRADPSLAARQEIAPLMLFMDPPDHTRLRSLVSGAFTPRTVAALLPSIEATANKLLDQVEESGESDLVADLAYPLPVAVICELLGVPQADEPLFGQWSSDLSRSLDPDILLTEDEKTRARQAEQDLAAYATDLIVARRRAPGDDLISQLALVEDEGDGLTDRELAQLIVLLLVAGHETTVNLIGNGAVALMRNREQLTRWHNNPALTKTAIDELLRFDSPVQFAMRVALDAVPLTGATVPALDQILIVLGAANHDPEVFDNPHQLDLARHNAARHVSFGGGIHHCLGMALARLEGQIVLGALVDRFPNIELRQEPRMRNQVVIRGYDQILVNAG